MWRRAALRKVSIVYLQMSSWELTRISAKASVEEYLTMIAGGLAGATPHMISASITAISRVVFEFKGKSVVPRF